MDRLLKNTGVVSSLGPFSSLTRCCDDSRGVVDACDASSGTGAVSFLLFRRCNGGDTGGETGGEIGVGGATHEEGSGTTSGEEDGGDGGAGRLIGGVEDGVLLLEANAGAINERNDGRCPELGDLGGIGAAGEAARRISCYVLVF